MTMLEMNKFMTEQQETREKILNNTKESHKANEDLEAAKRMLDNLTEAFTGKMKC